MRWVESAGGPLIFVPSDVAPLWAGVRTSGRIVSDYDRACRIDDELGMINVGDRLALILGDEPFPTAILPQPDGGLLVRWVYANSDDPVLKIPDQLEGKSFDPTDLYLEAPHDERWLLFDSGEPGDVKHDDVAELTLAAGQYAIDRLVFEPDPDTKFLVHRLVRSR
jgi:hypothetical protein